MLHCLPSHVHSSAVFFPLHAQACYREEPQYAEEKKNADGCPVLSQHLSYVKPTLRSLDDFNSRHDPPVRTNDYSRSHNVNFCRVAAVSHIQSTDISIFPFSSSPPPPPLLIPIVTPPSTPLSPDIHPEMRSIARPRRAGTAAAYRCMR